jgi:hypothetical protein
MKTLKECAKQARMQAGVKRIKYAGMFHYNGIHYYNFVFGKNSRSLPIYDLPANQKISISFENYNL